MSEKIISLSGAPISADGQYAQNATLVEALEGLLERARNGQMVGACVVAMERDDACPYHIVGQVGGFKMAGSMAAALHHLNMINTSDG